LETIECQPITLAPLPVRVSRRSRKEEGRQNPRGKLLLLDVVGLLVRKPRTVSELVHLTGGVPETVRCDVVLLSEEGLVVEDEDKEGLTHGARRWRWAWK
jgi:hypothetical protein